MSSPPNRFDWNHIRAFLATAEEGSLSAAARRLHLTQPTLSRQVAALEEELGLMLFERIGKSLHLTQAGVELLEHTRPMGLAADRIALAAMGQSQSITGTVRITASDIYSAYVLPQMLHRLSKLAPELNVEIIAANDIRDLMRREADIAIRHVRPEQPELITRLVHEDTAHFYAAPTYLERFGRPEVFEDLSRHEFISFGSVKETIDYLRPLGITLTARNFRHSSHNGLVAWELVRKGFGLAPMADRVGTLTPEVERLFPGMEPIRFPVWLTTHRELHTSRKIRIVFDLLADMLSAK
ncbi:LysR family transcriptional regulator [Phycobacter sp. K97]|uniref:LysR family transcriptional regulator n=1 Tax=Phycobacter sedimenti TaxID=3133977 RepID=UPI00311E3E7C